MPPELWICVYYFWPWECLGCHPAKLGKTCLVECVHVYVHGSGWGCFLGGFCCFFAGTYCFGNLMQIKNEWEDYISVMHIWWWSEFTLCGCGYLHLFQNRKYQPICCGFFFFSVWLVLLQPADIENLNFFFLQHCIFFQHLRKKSWFSASLLPFSKNLMLRRQKINKSEERL